MSARSENVDSRPKIPLSIETTMPLSDKGLLRIVYPTRQYLKDNHDSLQIVGITYRPAFNTRDLTLQYAIPTAMARRVFERATRTETKDIEKLTHDEGFVHWRLGSRDHHLDTLLDLLGAREAQGIIGVVLPKRYSRERTYTEKQIINDLREKERRALKELTQKLSSDQHSYEFVLELLNESNDLFVGAGISLVETLGDKIRFTDDLKMVSKNQSVSPFIQRRAQRAINL